MNIFSKATRYFDSDGKLREVGIYETPGGGSIVDKDRIKVAKKSVNQFQRELLKYDNAFAEYASMDIENETVNTYNLMYNRGKLGLFGAKINQGLTLNEIMQVSKDEDLMAIAGSREAHKFGISTRLANAVQPFFEAQAKNHPHLQKISDFVTKAANDGRMPLTAHSAAMMRIAFDKKYYNDCRNPFADKEKIAEDYKRAVDNLEKMAEVDGISKEKLHQTYTDKVCEQMNYDDSFRKMYSGAAFGNVRPGRMKENGYVKSVILKGTDAKAIDAWSELEVNIPQSFDKVMEDFTESMRLQYSRCETRADAGRAIFSKECIEMKNQLWETVKEDYPDRYDEARYEIVRAECNTAKEWGMTHFTGNERNEFEEMPFMKPYGEYVAKQQGYETAYEQQAALAAEHAAERQNNNEEALKDMLVGKSDEECAALFDDYIDDVSDTAEDEIKFADMKDEEIAKEIIRLENERDAIVVASEKYEQFANGLNRKTMDDMEALSNGLAEYNNKIQELDTETQKRGYTGRYDMLDELKKRMGEKYGSIGHTITDSESEEAKALQKQILEGKLNVSSELAGRIVGVDDATVNIKKPAEVQVESIQNNQFDINEYDDPDYFEQQKIADREEKSAEVQTEKKEPKIETPVAETPVAETKTPVKVVPKKVNSALNSYYTSGMNGQTAIPKEVEGDSFVK